MHDSNGILFDDLPSTATYAVRHWLYVPADLTSNAWDGRVGTLIIVQNRSGGPDAKADTGSYAVQSLLNPGPGGRQFLLKKLNDPGTAVTADASVDAKDEIHEVFLGDGALPAKCSCDAGRAGMPICKHRDALAAVVAAGGLPEPEFAEGEELP